MFAEPLSMVIHRCFKPNPSVSILISNFHRLHRRSFSDFPANQTPRAAAIEIQNILKLNSDKSIAAVHSSLNERRFTLTEDLVLEVLKRHRSDWKPAFAFFSWITEGGGNGGGYSPVTKVFNEAIDILGKMRRFDELNQVLDVMSERGNLFSESTYSVVLNRYAAAHKVEEAIEFLEKRKRFGLEIDLIAFQTLLLSLCRYKHVEAAEFLYHNRKNEFKDEIKTRNIILNGWCVKGSLREAKRFWNDIVSSKCKPDKFTYAIFINSLCKAGKISTAVKLFQAMWEKGCKPDVAICNCIIEGLCFKKRIPEALEIFREMNERDCLPETATYNSLIKHMCKIRRMEKAYELLGEMEEQGGECSPNARTYSYFITSAKKPEEVDVILQRMEKKGCKMIGDTYNLLLRLYMNWGRLERAKTTWEEMERVGLGPDQRSYTIMVHGLYEKGMLEDALRYFDEMKMKGMMPEPRTMLLVDAMNITLKDRGNGSEKVALKSETTKHRR